MCSTGQLQAGARSVQRTIRNNFMDNTKQEAIDMLLFNNAFSGDLGQKARALLERADVFGKFHSNLFPVQFPALVVELLICFHSNYRFRQPLCYLAPVPFKKAVCDRWGDFTTSEKLRVCIGTWNVNGGKHVRSIALKNQSTTDWLLDGPTLSGVAKEHVSFSGMLITLLHTLHTM